MVRITVFEVLTHLNCARHKIDIHCSNLHQFMVKGKVTEGCTLIRAPDSAGERPTW